MAKFDMDEHEKRMREILSPAPAGGQGIRERLVEEVKRRKGRVANGKAKPATIKTA